MHDPAPPPPPDPADVFTTDDGRTFRLRPIQASDADALVRAFTRLTPEQIRLRVFHRLGALSPRVAAWLCSPDPATANAFVVTDAQGEIRGDGRFYIDADRAGAEFGVIVDPAVIGIGIGRVLTQRLIEAARARGLPELWGLVLAENVSMLELARQLGARVEAAPGEPGVLRVAFRLAA